MKRSRALACIAMALAIGACQTVRQPMWDMPPGVKTMDVAGYPIAYVERGSGPVLVLVHGSLNDYRYFMPQVEGLSSRFRVVSLSLRHYYPEPWTGKGEFSYTVHARDLAAFIEGLHAGPVNLVGWSRGGNVVLVMARERPDLIAKLVLMDPAVSELVVGEAGEEARIGRLRTVQEYFEKNDIDGGLRYFINAVNGAGAWDGMTEALREGRRQNAWTLVGQFGDLERVSCADVAALKMPVLLMTGERSPRQFAPILDKIQQCLPAARRYVVPRAVHQMSQSNPADSNAELTRFLLSE